ncbi:unnamed protein product [Candidula unifasciata]|uniref:EGF-like domain-containing protein n=1 Tax=Candidula unifasciata TaxID=100452 RepID=A0A8S3YMR9_9EUPU|nr:unnamed protein product [Candidula unifasciata]
MSPLATNTRTVALLLAGHKYFEVDKRKGNDVMWKFDERVYYKHFPMPRLRRLHPQVSSNCDRSVYSCIEFLAGIKQDIFNKTDLERFQMRTTATYYMCWYTMKGEEPLKNFMERRNCLEGINNVPDAAAVDYRITDYRADSSSDPLLCAAILFCPDPCYGRETSGSVQSSSALSNDPGNPCRHFKDRTCKWDFSDNDDFLDLQKNKFNITCKCDQTGFRFNSRFELCVDIDECEDIHTKCDKGKQCENTAGSYECLCPRGQRFDISKDKCIEHAPLPKHSFARTGKVRAHIQRSAFMRMVEYILGLRKDTGA